jgi:HTH-type transcriptional regulator/antitoxin HigA
MTGIINKKKYGSLLAQTLPRKIETEAENERILKIIEGLMRKGENNLSSEEETLFVLLCELVEEFEEQAYPMPDLLPHERLKYILEERGLKQKDLAQLFGSEGVVSEIVSGSRPITLKTAKKLAVFLKVSSYEIFV